MRNLFFYGTLRHPALLEVVMGRGAADLSVSDAVLPDYRVSAVSEGPFPAIAPDKGAQAVGVLVSGLSDADIARTDFYEGSFAYDLTPVTLADGRAAEVYLPQPDLWTLDGPWSLQAWAAAHGEMSVIAAREVMGYYGNKSRDEVAGMFPMIRARAASTLRAAQSRHGSDAFRGQIDVLKRARPYARFYVLDDIALQHEHFDGTMSDVLDRAVFVKSDAAFVLPYDPVRDCVLLVEQIRVGPIARGDRTCWHMEPIAGGIDAGEDPETAARREAREEAGLEIGAMELIAEIYPTAGSSSEFFYLFLGIADLPDTATGAGGVETENEDIRSHIWSFDTLMERIARFDVANGALVTSAYYLARHRDRLRSDGASATPSGN